VDVSEDLMMAEPVPPIDIADEIDKDFSFHGQKALGQWQEDINETLKSLKWKGVSDALIDALRRGVGMHHEGCKTVYRQAVEILFRRGFLRVVFATGTLALGINMPCRSTIFCGDALDLNGLMFRQMSGRAGRRGFDLLGQVVFLDMAFPKVRRLIASELSSLTGEFTLSPTTLLRVMHSWDRLKSQALCGDNQIEDKMEDIAKCLSPMLTTPFFKSKRANLEVQVTYFARYAAELLYQEGLMKNDGSPSNLANIVTHMFEVEPANIVLSRLLSSGVLHEYLQREAPKERKGERRTHLTVKLTAILGWLLYPRRLPSTIPKERAPRKKHHPSEKCPALPDLPKKIRAEVQKYNARVFELFQQFAWSVASTQKIGEDDLTLPLSHAKFRPGWDARGEPFDKKSQYAGRLIGQLTRFRARSPFSAVSGSGDNFSSPSELIASVRGVIHLDLNSMPMVAPSLQGCSCLEPTNSWALDLMMHGKMRYLSEDNGISSTQTYKLVKSFVDAVKMATAALKAFAPKDDIVLTTLLQLGTEMQSTLSSI